MMLSLDYSSSDEDIDDSDIRNKSLKVLNKPKTESIVNPFDANNYELSSSEDEVEDKEPKDYSNPQKIQTPLVVIKDSNEGQNSSDVHNCTQIPSKISIFSNPFKEEETKELSHLERHVKLSDNKTLVGNSEEKKSQTICWSYHKHKRCRFGNRCRFRHNDTDFIDTKAIKRSNCDKKRVGITDSLIPPKKAIKAYYSQQNI